jgi:hypothetical protein
MRILTNLKAEHMFHVTHRTANLQLNSADKMSYKIKAAHPIKRVRLFQLSFHVSLLLPQE